MVAPPAPIKKPVAASADAIAPPESPVRTLIAKPVDVEPRRRVSKCSVRIGLAGRPSTHSIRPAADAPVLQTIRPVFRPDKNTFSIRRKRADE